MIRTKRGAARRYRAIINRCYKDAKGGTCFGVDMPTIHVLWPNRAKEIRELRAQYKSLPE